MKDMFTSLEDQGRRPDSVIPSSPYDMSTASLRLSAIAVLPSQFFSPPRSHYKGEVALMYAVLEDAVKCFAKQFVEKGLRTQRLAAEAEEWFFADDERWPFSFVNVCTALEINPQYLRQGLEHWRQQRPTELKQMRQQAVHRTPCLKTAA
ncbi:MAG: hypothetical protein HY268_10455 [Deltaproteobacteria bacterium]|nr:hypothetical protein [Deltaproteobacteria bacterium]